jgi:hypothetical protein
LFQVFAHELPQLRVAGDLPVSVTAPSALGSALGGPRTVVARGYVVFRRISLLTVRRTTAQLQGIGTHAAPDMQKVGNGDPFRLERNRAEITAGL